MTAPPLEFRVLAFFPADHAEVVNGKAYVHGGFWNRLRFPGYPQVLPAMALVAVIEVPFSAYHREHTIEIGMEDPDGNRLPLRVQANFRIGAAADMDYGDPTVMPIAVPVHGLVLPRPGDYSFTISIDGDERARYPIRAMRSPAPMQANLGPRKPDPPASEAG